MERDLQEAKINKKTLQENPELARDVLTIMNQAQDQANANGAVINVNAPPPPPPPPMGGGGPKPPPLPGSIPTTTSTSSSAPPPPPPSNSNSGGGRGGLLSQIQEGTKLRKVETNNERPQSTTGGNNLLSTLQVALQNHRKDIEGEDDKDDWSNDWSDEDN